MRQITQLIDDVVALTKCSLEDAELIEGYLKEKYGEGSYIDWPRLVAAVNTTHLIMLHYKYGQN